MEGFGYNVPTAAHWISTSAANSTGVSGLAIIHCFYSMFYFLSYCTPAKRAQLLTASAVLAPPEGVLIRDMMPITAQALLNTNIHNVNAESLRDYVAYHAMGLTDEMIDHAFGVKLDSAFESYFNVSSSYTIEPPLPNSFILIPARPVQPSEPSKETYGEEEEEEEVVPMETEDVTTQEEAQVPQFDFPRTQLDCAIKGWQMLNEEVARLLCPSERGALSVL